MSLETAKPSCELLLIVCGDVPGHRHALDHVAALCRSLEADAAPGTVRLNVIDLAADPGAARRYDVVVTPLLIRLDSLPQRRVSGDLSRQGYVRRGLGLAPRADAIDATPHVRRERAGAR